MSVRNLEYLFNAKSIAVIGASDRPHSVGATVFRNLIGGAFTGPIWPINSRRSTVAGHRAFPSVGALPTPAELAVICTPAATVPQLVAELGAVGTKAAVVLTAGLSSVMTGDGRNLTDAMLAAARPHLLRVLGPNCFGMLVPGIGLNASFAHTDANVGDIAFVAQSGALMAAMLDWAKTHGIGFSHFISLGDAADVDCGDVLDYLASDHTRAILLYLESVTAARKFMSAARAAARNKPVIAIKAGRVAEASKAAASHTGALAGADDVYDAAIRRAGMLRVATTLDLFDAGDAETRKAVARQPLGHHHERRRTRGHGHRRADRVEGVGSVVRRDDRKSERGVAYDMVAWQSGGYHRRCPARALRRSAESTARCDRSRCAAVYSCRRRSLQVPRLPMRVRR